MPFSIAASGLAATAIHGFSHIPGKHTSCARGAGAQSAQECIRSANSRPPRSPCAPRHSRAYRKVGAFYIACLGIGVFPHAKRSGIQFALILSHYRICKPVTQVFDRLYIRLPRQPRKVNPRSHITSNTGYILYVRWEGKMEILNPAPNPNNDHRSFCSGRRFACLGALFSLSLIASIPLIAQSGSSAQPPATQSQSQGPAKGANEGRGRRRERENPPERKDEAIGEQGGFKHGQKRIV